VALEPDALLPSEDGVVGFLKLPFQLILLAVSRLFLGTAWLLLFLLFRDGQRAEYYADAIGLRLAGRQATLRMLERIHAAPGVERMTWLGETPDPIGVIVAKVRGLPAREMERIRRVERLLGTRLDASHPPTLYRIEVLEHQPDQPAALVLSHGEADAIDDELDRFREPMGRRLVDEYLSSVSA
jgi:heat shock protein HtpX